MLLGSSDPRHNRLEILPQGDHPAQKILKMALLLTSDLTDARGGIFFVKIGTNPYPWAKIQIHE